MKTLDLEILAMDLLSIQRHYEGFVRSAPNEMLVALANKNTDADYEVLVVLSIMAKVELAKRG